MLLYASATEEYKVCPLEMLVYASATKEHKVCPLEMFFFNTFIFLNH